MKGIIRGIEIVDYTKKDTGERVQGVNLFLNCKNSNVIGFENKNEFISATKNSFYSTVIAPYLGADINKLLDAQIYIDYSVTKRGNYTFTEICDLEITPKGDK